jgi:hypothetical protein
MMEGRSAEWAASQLRAHNGAAERAAALFFARREDSLELPKTKTLRVPGVINRRGARVMRRAAPTDNIAGTIDKIKSSQR